MEAPTTSSAESLADGGFTDPHVLKALRYIDDVLSGRVAACKYVRQACARQRADLERYKDHPVFYFSEAHAGRACRFAELLPHVKGPKATNTELLILEDWQAFIFTTVFGWRRLDTGGRRFRRAYLEVPRGNGKSYMSSAIALYGLCADGEAGPEVYAAATVQSQAEIVWGVAKAMLRNAPALAKRLGTKVGKKIIQHPKSNGTFQPMTRDANANEGQNVHVAIVDELHAHKDRALYDVIETACQKRHSSLLSVITTAGDDTAGICYEVRTFCAKVLAGETTDDAQFGIIYTVDEGEESEALNRPELWAKANPNWNVSVEPESFASLARKALEVPSARANFLRKHLNIWQRGDETWMDMGAWDRCTDTSLKVGQFAEEPCAIGLDLATKTDIACEAKLFWRDRDELVGDATKKVRHYYLFLESFLPEAAARASRNSQYSGWVADGHIRTTPGDVLDFDAVRRQVLLDAREHDVRAVGFDPWNATQLGSELVAEGVPMVELIPNTKNLSGPMKEFAALVLQGRIHHDGNPVLAWMLTNVVCHASGPLGEHVFPRKERPELKIDGVVAALLALNRAMVGEPATKTPAIRYA